MQIAVAERDQYYIDKIDKLIIQRDQGVVGDENSNTWNNNKNGQQPKTNPKLPEQINQGYANRNIHPFYEDDGIRIEVLSLQNFGVYLNLRLKYINKIPQTIIKIRSNLDRRYRAPDTYLIDDADNQYLAVKPYNVGRGQEPDMHNGVNLYPGVPQIYSFQYGVNNKSLGNSFIFSSTYSYCLGSDYCFPHTNLNISIRGLSLN